MRARRKPQLVYDKGEPVAVIIGIKQYEEMLELIEDAEDLAWLAEMRLKPVEYRPLEDVLGETAARV